jgi:lambda family phage portal protein
MIPKRRRHKVRRKRRGKPGLIASAGQAIANAVSVIPAVLDSTIFAFAPTWGENRKRARQRAQWLKRKNEVLEQQLQRFDGADSPVTRSRTWLTEEIPIDGVDADRFKTLRDRCQQLWDDEGFARGAIEGRVKQVVGLGLWPQPKIKDSKGISVEQAEVINASLKEKYRRWEMHAGLQQQSMWQLQRQAERGVGIKGEIFSVLSDRGGSPNFLRPPVPLTVEMIDADRCVTPPQEVGNKKVKLGIEYKAETGPDKDEIVAYWFSETSHTGTITYKRVDARFPNGQQKVLHCYDQMLPSQTRGLPWLLAAMNNLRDLKDATEARLIAFQVQSLFCAFIKTNTDPEALAEGTATDTRGDQRIEDLTPGTMTYLNADEEVDFADPSQPGAEYYQFVKANLHGVAAAVDFPYELLAKDWESTTFSSGRMSLLDGRLTFRCWQQMLNEKINRPIWQRFVVECVLFDKEDLGFTIDQFNSDSWNFLRCGWKGTGWPMLQPDKEIPAAMQAIEGNLETRQNFLHGQGEDFEEVATQNAKAKKRLDDLGLPSSMPLMNRTQEDDAEEPNPQPAGATT